jgi:hypothetical protein
MTTPATATAETVVHNLDDVIAGLADLVAEGVGSAVGLDGLDRARLADAIETSIVEHLESVLDGQV